MAVLRIISFQQAWRRSRGSSTWSCPPAGALIGISDARPRSRDAKAPELLRKSFAPEGVGNAGRTMHPQPRVQNRSKHTSIVTTGPPKLPGIPTRNGFNGLLRDLPGDR